MARVAMDLCLRVLKKSNKSRFDSYSLGNSVLIISHITFRFCRVHIFCDKLSRNSCRHWPFDHCHSLRSRRLEVAGERGNGRARGRHASRAPVFSCAHYLQAPATQATIATDLDSWRWPKGSRLLKRERVRLTSHVHMIHVQ